MGDWEWMGPAIRRKRQRSESGYWLSFFFFPFGLIKEKPPFSFTITIHPKTISFFFLKRYPKTISRSGFSGLDDQCNGRSRDECIEEGLVKG